MLAYYEARAAEYDDWYLRRGRYERGADPRRRLERRARRAPGAGSTRLPIRGEIVELAAGTGWWSPLLAARASCRSTTRARPRSTGRASAWSPTACAPTSTSATRGPSRIGAVDALFTGFWLSHVPRARLDDVPRRSSDAGSSPAGSSRSSTRCRIPSRARSTTRRPPTTPPSAASTTAASSRSSRSTTSRPSWRPRSPRAGFDDAAVTTTGRFFLTGSARARDA